MQWWKRREVWLGTLSVVLVAVLYNQLSAWLVPSVPPDLLAPEAGGPERRHALAADAVPDVKLDALAALHSVYDPRGRNLFQYGQRPAPTPPPPPPPPPEEVLRQEAQRRQEEEDQRRRVEEILRQKQQEEQQRQEQQAAMQPPPPQAAPPPEADYKFVGYMGKAQDKIAVLMHEGEVVLAKEGERLGKQFVVRQIEFDSVELGYTDPRFKDQKKLLPMGN